MTGTGEATIFSMISRVESTSPPGVFISIRTAWSWLAAADSQGAANVFGGDGLDGVVDRDLQDVGGAEGGERRARKQQCRIANPELLWPQAVAELRSAWTGEGARPHTNARPSTNISES